MNGLHMMYSMSTNGLNTFLELLPVHTCPGKLCWFQTVVEDWESACLNLIPFPRYISWPLNQQSSVLQTKEKDSFESK